MWSARARAVPVAGQRHRIHPPHPTSHSAAGRGLLPSGADDGDAGVKQHVERGVQIAKETRDL